MRFVGNPLYKPNGLSAFYLTLHTFGEYLELEQLFSAQLLSELTRLGFITLDLVARMRTWKHTGFNVDWGLSIPQENRAERESLCQYILIEEQIMPDYETVITD